jgi:hypothetical protein
MANTYPTLQTLLDKNVQERLLSTAIEEIGLASPEVTQIAAKTISGITAKTYVRTGVPKTGFRSPNDPVTFVSSQYETRVIELAPSSTAIFIDDLLAQADDQGEAELKAQETIGVMQGVLLSMGAQMFYGKDIDSKGFDGLKSFIDDSMTMSADTTAAADSEEGTSVYAIVEGPRGVQWVYGQNQSLSLSPFEDTFLPKDGGAVPGQAAKLNAWCAIVSASKLAAARLKNIGDADGTTLNDDKIAELISRFPAGTRPTKLLMNRKAAEQLRKSRTIYATASAGNAANGDSLGSAPSVEYAFGVPILVTDSILDDESDLSVYTGVSHFSSSGRSKAIAQAKSAKNSSAEA